MKSSRHFQKTSERNLWKTGDSRTHIHLQVCQNRIEISGRPYLSWGRGLWRVIVESLTVCLDLNDFSEGNRKRRLEIFYILKWLEHWKCSSQINVSSLLTLRPGARFNFQWISISPGRIWSRTKKRDLSVLLPWDNKAKLSLRFSYVTARAVRMLLACHSYQSECCENYCKSVLSSQIFSSYKEKRWYATVLLFNR